MARAPRAVVPKTSGQGVSRLSYQKGYGLAHSANAPSVKGSFSAGSPGTSRNYSKLTVPKGPSVPAMNVSYGDTYDPTNLEDVQAESPKRPAKNPMKGPSMGQRPPKAWKMK